MVKAPTSISQGPIDFAIVTALRVERDAVLQRLEATERIQEDGDPYTYILGKVSIPGTDFSYRVVLVQLADPGNVEAATATTHVVQRWLPNYILMVGIAGGIAAEGVRHGDVVVAHHVHYYEPGKRTAEGEQRRFVQYASDRMLRARAEDYETTDWKDDVAVDTPDNTGFVPRALFGPIASGELVIANEADLAKLKSESPKLLAVAMEGAGVAHAVATMNRQFLELRGISDLADRDKDDRWHPYAANAAAAFAIGFLRSRPVAPIAAQLSIQVDDAPSLAILRAESLRKIRPDEVLSALSETLKDRDHSTIALDFTDLSSQTLLRDPGLALTRLIDPDGPLLSTLTQRDQAELVFHGLVAIPLAFAIGYLVTDRQPVRIFDYHPDLESWTWPDDLQSEPPLQVSGIPTERSVEAGEVSIRISVTFSVSPESTDSIVVAPLASIDISVPEPGRNLVRSEAQVRAYGRVFRGALDNIVRKLPNATRVHIFYSGPVSLAFHFGQQVSENIHPPVTIWNYNRAYDFGYDMEAVSRGQGGLVSAPSAVNE